MSTTQVPVVFIDACVLFPPLVRRIVLGAAEAGLFRPRWSARVLDEWRIAVTRRHGTGAEDAVVAARAAMATQFRDALIPPDPEREADLRLPDPADAHVLAAALAADLLLTFNLRDFPRRTLAGLGLEARHPDGFLWELYSNAPKVMATVIGAALDEMSVARARGRSALKRAQLSRLGRAWEGGAAPVD